MGKTQSGMLLVERTGLMLGYYTEISGLAVSWVWMQRAHGRTEVYHSHANNFRWQTYRLATWW